ncbi:hypothetical protein ACLB2K_001619 [Fragaria x ananassa]
MPSSPLLPPLLHRRPRLPALRLLLLRRLPHHPALPLHRQNRPPEHAKIELTDSSSKSRDEYDARDTSYAVADDESPFAVQLAWVMALLDSNLEAKSKLYKKIKDSQEINACMGDTWCRKRSSELRQYHKNYQRETWSRLLSFLSHEGLSNHGKVQKPVLKERFKSFNAMFDEIHKTQSTRVVSDEQLQSELRVSISAVVIPAYRSFLGRFAQVLDPGRQTEKYVKGGGCGGERRRVKKLMIQTERGGGGGGERRRVWWSRAAEERERRRVKKLMIQNEFGIALWVKLSFQYLGLIHVSIC